MSSTTRSGARPWSLRRLLFVHRAGLPSIPGQKVGPSAMPGALAIGLGICGALLFLRACASARHRTGPAMA